SNSPVECEPLVTCLPPESHGVSRRRATRVGLFRAEDVVVGLVRSDPVPAVPLVFVAAGAAGDRDEGAVVPADFDRIRVRPMPPGPRLAEWFHSERGMAWVLFEAPEQLSSFGDDRGREFLELAFEVAGSDAAKRSTRQGAPRPHASRRR